MTKPRITRVDVPSISHGRDAEDALREAGFKTTLVTYDGGLVVWTDATRDETREALSGWGLLRGVVLSTLEAEPGQQELLG